MANTERFVTPEVMRLEALAIDDGGSELHRLLANQMCEIADLLERDGVVTIVEARGPDAEDVINTWTFRTPGTARRVI